MSGIASKAEVLIIITAYPYLLFATPIDVIADIKSVTIKPTIAFRSI